jgi:hypothetical protein
VILSQLAGPHRRPEPERLVHRHRHPARQPQLAQPQRRRRAVLRHHRQPELVAGGHRVVASAHLDKQPDAGPEDLVELAQLGLLPRARRQLRKLGARLEQRRDHRLGVARVKLVRRLLEELRQPGAAFDPAPGQIDAVEEPGRLGVAGERLEVLQHRAAVLGGAKALALVHAAAVGGDLAVGHAEQGIVGADVELEEPRQVVVGQPAPRRAVPEQPPRLPDADVRQLLGGERRVGRRLERLAGEHRRGGVVAVRVQALGREAGDDDVGLERADDPHQIGQHRAAVPDRQRLGRRLGVAEVAGAGEKLLGAVDAAGGEQLLGADEAEQRPLLGADQVLAAIAARQRQVGGAQQALAVQVGQKPRVLVVGVGGDIKDVADYGQPLDGAQELTSARLARRLLGKAGQRRQQHAQGKRRAEGAGSEAAEGGVAWVHVDLGPRLKV